MTVGVNLDELSSTATDRLGRDSVDDPKIDDGPILERKKRSHESGDQKTAKTVEKARNPVEGDHLVVQK